MPINYPNLIAVLDAEISKLMQARRLLLSLASTRPHKLKRTMSPEARARISAAQKKRWAQQKRAAKR